MHTAVTGLEAEDTALAFETIDISSGNPENCDDDEVIVPTGTTELSIFNPNQFPRWNLRMRVTGMIPYLKLLILYKVLLQRWMYHYSMRVSTGTCYHIGAHTKTER
jgi:hypothetical protein